MSFGGLSLRDLEYVVAVADEGSFTAAAARCAVAQPSLSAQVRKVEGQLGLALFERVGRAVRPTPTGAAAIEQARRVLAEATRLFEVGRERGDPLDGVLRLGAITTLGPYLVPHLLGPLRGTFPALRPILREGLTEDLLRALASGEVDAALVSLPVEDDRFVLAPVFFEPFVAVVSSRSPLAGRDALTLADLDDDDLILMQEGHCLRDQALALCARAGRGLADRHAASVETLRHLVAMGAGHSLLPALAVRPDPLLDGHLRYAPLDAVGRIVALAWRRRDPRSAAFARLAAFVAGAGVPGVRPLPDP
jgi:LysR family transcriptional regulator, hydrogen peroxide-inducible genes activator